jgi:hypothetical protein
MSFIIGTNLIRSLTILVKLKTFTRGSDKTRMLHTRRLMRLRAASGQRISYPKIPSRLRLSSLILKTLHGESTSTLLPLPLFMILEGFTVRSHLCIDSTRSLMFLPWSGRVTTNLILLTSRGVRRRCHPRPWRVLDLCWLRFVFHSRRFEPVDF